MERTKILTVISLGVGVQSSTMALMSAKGVLPKVDCAIFADTGFEPDFVYKYLEYLKQKLEFPIYVVNNGNIKDDIKDWINLDKRMPTAPFFTKNRETGKKGMLMRQCTNDYKIVPVARKIRELVGLTRGKHFPKDKFVEQWFGISLDEIVRIKISNKKYLTNYYPLIDLKMTRDGCLKWMTDNNYLLPEKSACICCPYHSDSFWQEMKDTKPNEFKQAVEYDAFIRQGNTKIKDELYLHRSCLPLDKIEFKKITKDNNLDFGFNNECEGMCGV